MKTCKQCGDNFCMSCFKHVHRKGRLRRHTFDPLVPMCDDCGDRAQVRGGLVVSYVSMVRGECVGEYRALIYGPSSSSQYTVETRATMSRAHHVFYARLLTSRPS